jgi:hypothetical protein
MTTLFEACLEVLLIFLAFVVGCQDLYTGVSGAIGLRIDICDADINDAGGARTICCTENHCTNTALSMIGSGGRI